MNEILKDLFSIRQYPLLNISPLIERVLWFRIENKNFVFRTTTRTT